MDSSKTTGWLISFIWFTTGGNVEEPEVPEIEPEPHDSTTEPSGGKVLEPVQPTSKPDVDDEYKDSETTPKPDDSKPEPDIDCDLQFNTHIKKLTKHVKKSQWVFPEDDVKSLKNNDKTGKCCWDVYTCMDR